MSTTHDAVREQVRERYAAAARISLAGEPTSCCAPSCCEETAQVAADLQSAFSEGAGALRRARRNGVSRWPPLSTAI